MGSQTPHGYPYPVGTDRVMDGDNAIQALAEAVDAHLRRGVASGSISMPITAVNTTAFATVTFPAGRFTATPIVATAVGASGATPFFPVTVSAVTATGCTLGAARSSGTAAFPAYWIAHQE
jgi:hypothetical protein